jgi:hypothetical protein
LVFIIYRVGQPVSRLSHNQEKMGSTPIPETKLMDLLRQKIPLYYRGFFVSRNEVLTNIFVGAILYLDVTRL